MLENLIIYIYPWRPNILIYTVISSMIDITHIIQKYHCLCFLSLSKHEKLSYKSELVEDSVLLIS